MTGLKEDKLFKMDRCKGSVISTSLLCGEEKESPIHKLCTAKNVQTVLKSGRPRPRTYKDAGKENFEFLSKHFDGNNFDQSQ